MCECTQYPSLKLEGLLAGQFIPNLTILFHTNFLDTQLRSEEFAGSQIESIPSFSMIHSMNERVICNGLQKSKHEECDVMSTVFFLYLITCNKNAKVVHLQRKSLYVNMDDEHFMNHFCKIND